MLILGISRLVLINHKIVNIIYPSGHLASNIFNENNFIANICIIFHSDRLIVNVLTELILILIVSVSY